MEVLATKKPLLIMMVQLQKTTTNKDENGNVTSIVEEFTEVLSNRCNNRTRTTTRTRGNVTQEPEPE